MAGLSSIRLQENKEKVLSLWEERCLKEVPAAGTPHPLELRDSLPLYLDHLSEALATNRKMDFRSIYARDQEAARIGKLHGADRAGNKSYVLTEVIFEYHILREVIFQVLEEQSLLSAASRDIILDSIEQAVNDAAVEFSEIHTDIQQTFVDTLTHDLKNPISVVKLSAELLLKFSEIPPGGTKAVNRILRSVGRLESMIRDLLDVSRMREGALLALEFTQCDLGFVIRKAAEDLCAVYGDRIRFENQEVFDGYWACDGLRRSVENLVANAVKYGTENTPITITLKRDEAVVEVTVHNQGPPILEYELPLLFQRYCRSKISKDGAKPGLGLGLTLVKGIIDAHNGNVRAESTLEQGTSFILEIPTQTIPA